MGNFDRNFTPYLSNDNRSNEHVTRKNSKKPKHMYSDEFLQAQSYNNNNSGKIGTPGNEGLNFAIYYMLNLLTGRRRPKIQKHYPTSDEGTLERWGDLIRQSCSVIIPKELLSKYDLSNINITKMQPFIWEVLCPICSKKIRLQLTHEGKYLNFKVKFFCIPHIHLNLYIFFSDQTLSAI